MIPYLGLSTIEIGFIKIQIWGLMVALGFLAGIFISYRRIKAKGWSTENFWDAIFWILFFSLIGGRLFHVLFYEWSYYSRHLLEIINIWDGGMSSFGGFSGAALAGWVYFKKHKMNFLAWANQFIFALPLGLFIGRLGCFLLNEHPGIKTDFILGVQFPDAVRHDLGLYLSLNAFVLFLVFLFLDRKPRGDYFYVALFLSWYGVSRFFLDFLRIWDSPLADTRYFYLTPAQYLSALMLIVGIYLFWRKKKNKKQVPSS